MKARPALTHLDARGRAAMVDVSGKPVTAREAVAEAVLLLRRDTWRLVESGLAAKGDALAAARIAGVMAAKRTPDLIPLCHPLALSKVAVEFEARPRGAARTAVRVVATARCEGRTGAEMEAMTAACVAALTLYDMVKAADRWARIERVQLLEKRGGKSGHVRRPGRGA